MKNLLLFAPLLVFSCAAARTQITPSKPMTAVKKEVEALECQHSEVQVKKDYAFLDKSFADDLIYTHFNGHQNNKTEYI